MCSEGNNIFTRLWNVIFMKQSRTFVAISLVLTTNANELQHYKIKHTFTIGEKHIWSRTRV